MKDFRILIGCSYIYGKSLSHELIKYDNVSFAYNTTEFHCYEEMDGQIVNFNVAVGASASYEKVFDLEKMPALSKELLEKMLPYESMAIKLEMRRTHMPVVNYEEAKKDYHKHLRFWNYMFEKYAINVVFFECSPHIAYEYIIYALSMVKKIPVILCTPSSIPTRRPYGNAIEDEGNPIKEYYELICKEMKAEDCILEGNVKEFYEKYSQSIDKIKDERKKHKFEKTSLKDIKKHFYEHHLGLKGRLKPVKRRMQMIKYLLKKERSLEWYKKYQKDEINRLKKECCDIQSYQRYVAMSQKKYNKIAIEPDYNKKYIYFALQLTPEETTIPRAGVFSEQYTSIQLLARAAEKVGVSVYVKEHFVQAFRSRFVYKELQNIPNVSLIKTTVSSFDLMNNSIAVATQTGTCILEGALRGKPALVFGEGAVWKGFPTMFEIVDEEQGADIICNILKGFSVDQDEVKKYFYAIQKKTIGFYVQDDWRRQGETKEHKKSLREIVELIQEYLKEYN